MECPQCHGALELRAHGVLDAHHSRERVGPGAQGGHEVVAELVLHRAVLVPRGAQGAQGAGEVGPGLGRNV